MTRRLGLAVLAVALVNFPSAGRAAPVVYTAVLNGPNESPPTASPGTGFAIVTIDVTARTLRVQATFTNLVAATTASHIHGPTATPGSGNAGVATQLPSFGGFPLGVTNGTYDQTFDTSLAATYNPAFMAANGGTPAGAEAALAASLRGGTAYLNIHSSTYPAGEIRGFLLEIPGEGSFAAAANTITIGGEGAFGLGSSRTAAPALLGPFSDAPGSSLVVNIAHRQRPDGMRMDEASGTSENATVTWVLAAAFVLTCLAATVARIRG